MKDKIYTYRGRVKIGYNLVFSLGSSWPNSNIKFLENEVVASMWPFRKRIPYLKIKKLVWSTAGYIRFEHEAGGFPYVAFYLLTGKNSPELTTICRILKSKGVVWEEIKEL